MGRPGGFTPVMLSGTACRLMLLLLGGVAVALAMNAVPRLALLTLEAVPLLVTLLAANKTLVVVVPAVPLYFHSPQRSWYSGLRRVCQQHCPAALSPQQPPI